MVSDLCLYPPINDKEIVRTLRKELPFYKMSAELEVSEGLSECKDILSWHFKYSGKFNIAEGTAPETVLKSGQCARPQFFEAACQLAVLLPTCAPADRVFSILNSRFGKGSSGSWSLGDYVSASVMLCFNNRQP